MAQPNKDRLSNLQGKQNLDLSPADGNGGFVGAQNGSAPGFAFVEGKKGSVTSMPIWDQQSSGMGVTDNAGSEDGDPEGIAGLQDSTDEKASYKHIQTDEGLPQTYRNAQGAGDAGPSGSDEPDGRGVGEVNPDTQSVPDASAGEHELPDMPQTAVTHDSGDSAPYFKR